MNSKERFLEAAAELFSKYGFAGVSVRDIAKALGMRESAMYKHYANKADVLQAVIAKAKEKLQAFQNNFDAAGKSVKTALCEIQEKLFDFYTTDAFMSRFRKIMIISQYEDGESKARFREMFIDKSLVYYENVFAQAAQAESVQADAKRMAYELYATLFLLLQQYDSEDSPEALLSAKQLLRAHVEAFFDRYGFLEEKEKSYGHA